MIAITYNKGVVLYKQHFGKLSGGTMAVTALKHFPSFFKRCTNPRAKQFLQDPCPIQNSVATMRVYKNIGAFSIW